MLWARDRSTRVSSSSVCELWLTLVVVYHHCDELRTCFEGVGPKLFAFSEESRVHSRWSITEEYVHSLFEMSPIRRVIGVILLYLLIAAGITEYQFKNVHSKYISRVIIKSKDLLMIVVNNLKSKQVIWDI